VSLRGDLDRANESYEAALKVALSEPPIFTATAEFCETLRRFVRTGGLGHKRSPLV
jgi:hypothetical protein